MSVTSVNVISVGGVSDLSVDSQQMLQHQPNIIKSILGEGNASEPRGFYSEGIMGSQSLLHLGILYIRLSERSLALSKVLCSIKHIL